MPDPTHGHQTQKQINPSTCRQRPGRCDSDIYGIINDKHLLRVHTRRCLRYSSGLSLAGQEAWYIRLRENTKKLSHIDLDFFL